MSGEQQVSESERTISHWAHFQLTDPEEPERVHEVAQGVATLFPNGAFACGNEAFHQRDGVSIETEDGMKFLKKRGYRKELSIEPPGGDVYRFLYCGFFWHRLIPQYTKRPNVFVRPLMDIYGNHGWLGGSCVLLFRVGQVVFWLLVLSLFAAVLMLMLGGAS